MCIRDSLYGAQRARYISILHTLFAAGSMAAPLFAASCIAAGGWQMGYLISGGLMGGAAVLFMVLARVAGAPVPTLEPGAARSAQGGAIPYRQILASPFIRWLCLGSALLSGVTYLTIWLPTYLDWYDKSVYTLSLIHI